ncbi:MULTISPECIES: flagellar hook-length control protein FliK [unclassified Modicisalibacter]|uniref:flagellar hook-length control protein FliK n=1 Tax=unclassified Modicisalibacter TaxID=2679913 RepID=UPI001CCF607C|nr:flagellar hook-length control protein FliK [Modicisalibacter sp. R2A 31.J]MBZ9574328.1 flagellar hook-length control protein FliK [Modicisalibacter sp. MOD 31.J]
MSGVITPLIDTLLHQVLGKRGEAPVFRDMPQPVKPMAPGSAPRAVHSDSRLESGRAGAAVVQPRLVADGEGRPATAGSPLLPSSTATHFSPAARTIADVLLKFPAPPSVLTASTPLVADPASVSASQVANRLQGSIASSGLFYESHLASWFRGNLTRGDLLREPQMQFAPPPAAHKGNARPAGPSLTPMNEQAAASRSGVPALATATFRPVAGPVAAVVGDAGTLASLDLDTADVDTRHGPVAARADDALQHLVRHQLELLVTPTLRWEGDVWSGLFMALALHMPAGLEERDSRQGDGSQQGEEELVWHSEMTLRLRRLGELDVQLRLRDRAVSLEIRADDAATLDSLQSGKAEFESRLRRCGLDEVRVDVLPAVASRDEAAVDENRERHS